LQSDFVKHNFSVSKKAHTFIKTVQCNKKNYKINEKIIIDIKYQMLNPKKPVLLNFGVGIYSENLNEYIFGYNTQTDDVKFLSKSKGEIFSIIQKHNLLPGDYYLNIVCFEKNEQEFIDFIGKACSFSISGHSKYRGLVDLEHHWREKLL